jgi:hypothetical protein
MPLPRLTPPYNTIHRPRNATLRYAITSLNHANAKRNLTLPSHYYAILSRRDTRRNTAIAKQDFTTLYYTLPLPNKISRNLAYTLQYQTKLCLNKTVHHCTMPSLNGTSLCPHMTEQYYAKTTLNQTLPRPHQALRCQGFTSLHFAITQHYLAITLRYQTVPTLYNT